MRTLAILSMFLLNGCGGLNIGASSGNSSAKVKVTGNGVETQATGDGSSTTVDTKTNGNGSTSTSVDTKTDGTSESPSTNGSSSKTTSAPTTAQDAWNIYCSGQIPRVSDPTSVSADSYVTITKTAAITMTKDLEVLCIFLDGNKARATLDGSHSIQKLVLYGHSIDSSLTLTIKNGATVHVEAAILGGIDDVFHVTHDSGGTLTCPSGNMISTTSGVRGILDCKP